MPMPYTLAKGTILAVLEDLANPSGPGELARLDDHLGRLRAGEPLTAISLVDSPNVNDPRLPPLLDRLERYWFGKRSDGSGDYRPQAPFGGTTTRTGYFVGYYGDVETIIRETMIRAVEVAFGIAHGAPLGVDPPRQWPIEILWKCPNPWFEGWVTWRRHGPGRTEGQVTAVVSSPADDRNALVDTVALPPGAEQPLPDPASPPTDGQGLWVITHERHVQHAAGVVTSLPAGPDEEPTPQLEEDGAPWIGLPAGRWAVPVPSTTWRGVGEVDVVQLPEDAGGAPPLGARYEP